jgi:hypothetical protein
MIGYLLGVAGGAAWVLSALLTFYYVSVTVFPERLAPPALSRSVFLDDKLAFLRDRHEAGPTLLAVGSSVTWRQLDGEPFAAAAGGPSAVLNGGTAYLQLSQTRFLTKFYQDHLKGVRTVMLLTGLPDFRNCTSEPVELLDERDGAAYAFDREPAGPLYVKYFAPVRYLKAFATLPTARRPFVGDRYNDRYGSGPLLVPAAEVSGLRYGAIEPDAACAAALEGLAQDLRRRGVSLVVVFAPVHPEHRRLFAASHAQLKALRAELEPALRANGGRVIDLDEDPRFSAPDFFDAFHLQWPAVRRLSRIIAERMAPAGGAVAGVTADGRPPPGSGG